MVLKNIDISEYDGDYIFESSFPCPFQSHIKAVKRPLTPLKIPSLPWLCRSKDVQCMNQYNRGRIQTAIRFLDHWTLRVRTEVFTDGHGIYWC